MRTRDLTDLLLLAALWGASFLFMRYAAPAFGPIALAEVRVAVAAAVLLPLFLRPQNLAALRAHVGPIALVGTLNSALPFALFAYATLTLTAGFTAVINATTPMTAALVGWVWLRNRIRPSQWLGLAIGLAGVVVLVWGKIDWRPGSSQWNTTLAIAAGLVGASAYGVAANYARARLERVASPVVAAGSQIAAAVVLLPLAIAYWPAVPPPASSWLAAIALGVLCTGLAYLLYFRLIARLGAMRAAAVTFLIPAFAALFEWLLTDTAISAQMLAGALVIFVGTALTLGFINLEVKAAG